MRKRFNTFLQSIRRRNRRVGQADPTIMRTPVQARQGFLGRPVLLVLIASMALMIASLAMVLMTGR